MFSKTVKLKLSKKEVEGLRYWHNLADFSEVSYYVGVDLTDLLDRLADEVSK